MFMRAEEQAGLLSWMRDQSDAAALEERAVATSPDAFQSLLMGEPGTWVIMDDGICPTGCTRCSDGGPPIQITKGEYRRHAPVPPDHNGNPRNCPRCRFFITGPCFLVGLQARFNATGLALQSLSSEYRGKQSRLAELDIARHEAQTGGEPFHRHREHQAAADAVDAAAATLDETMHSWHAIFGLAQQCARMLRADDRSVEDGRFALVSVGGPQDVEVALEATTDFELVDSICHSADWFASINPEVANLKRSRILDAMLTRNDRKPFFSFLEEGDALKVGNEFTRLLQARLGRTETLRVMEGEALLLDAGVLTEIESLLAGADKQFQPVVPGQLLLGSSRG